MEFTTVTELLQIGIPLERAAKLDIRAPLAGFLEPLAKKNPGFGGLLTLLVGVLWVELLSQQLELALLTSALVDRGVFKFDIFDSPTTSTLPSSFSSTAPKLESPLCAQPYRLFPCFSGVRRGNVAVDLGLVGVLSVLLALNVWCGSWIVFSGGLDDASDPVKGARESLGFTGTFSTSSKLGFLPEFRRKNLKSFNILRTKTPINKVEKADFLKSWNK